MQEECPVSLYDGMEGYRIADMMYSRFHRHSPGGMLYHYQRFRSSLATQYLIQYHEKRFE